MQLSNIRWETKCHLAILGGKQTLLNKVGNKVLLALGGKQKSNIMMDNTS